MAGRVVVSGFGPWGAIDENPTALVVARLAAAGLPGLATVIVPVDTGQVTGLVEAVLDAHRPLAWIGLGLADGSAVVAVERVAINLRDFGEPDVGGARPAGAPVVAGGPAAYPATLPVEALRRRLRGEGVPARLSTTAGTFLCNQLMYQVLHAVAERGWATRAGFLHVPAHPALVARRDGAGGQTPSMHLDLVERAVLAAVEVAREEPQGGGCFTKR